MADRRFVAPGPPWRVPPLLTDCDSPMDAERLNQTETRLEDLAQRLEDLRGYL